MKIYRQHHCDRQHRSERAFLQCAIRNSAWVVGAGTYAVIAWCDRPTVTLWESIVTAQAGLSEVDGLRCGGKCRGRHELVKIDIREPACT